MNQLCKEPGAEKPHAGFWCAAKAARWKREGPSVGTDRQTHQIALRRSAKELSRNKLNNIAEDKFAWARMRKEA